MHKKFTIHHKTAIGTLLRTIIIAIVAVMFMPSVSAQSDDNKNFVVVLDAGHGGNDPGAVGLKGKEKNINLAVVLKLGKLIEENMPDVTVQYTRKRDVFVGLKERTEIAHRHHGDLFISVHSNSVSKKNKRRKTLSGVSTYVLGTAKSAENLETAQRENSVIMLEDDYTSKYEGFDPHSPESYIIFETMQDSYRERSISFAALVQKEMKSVAGRKDNGVRQNGFYVLAFTGMPSILVELDYLCNPTQEKYLLSEAGQNEMAQALYNAFVIYKASYDGKSDAIAAVQEAQKAASQYQESEQAEECESTSDESSTSIEADSKTKVYKVQFMALPKKLSSNSKHFKGLSPVDYYKENGYYKYTYGASTTREGIESDLKKVRKLFKDAFIIVMQDGKRVAYEQ